MRIGLFATANKARLLSNVAKVLPAAIAPRRRNGEPALIDAAGRVEVAVCVCACLLRANNINLIRWSSVACSLRDLGRREFRQLGFEGVLHKLGVGRREYRRRAGVDRQSDGRPAGRQWADPIGTSPLID